MLEIIAMTVDDAKAIEEVGADRIELVSALSEGGVTPSYAVIKRVVQSVGIPVNVMIRPHAKSFIYSKEDVDIMKEDINIVKDLGANGVVLGALDKDGDICEEFLEDVLYVCQGLEVTFHRAIDDLKDPVQGIKKLSKYKEIKTILTSGGRGYIGSNTSVIKEMIENAGHINVMIGGGLNLENIRDIANLTGATEYHFGTAVRYNKSCFGDIDRKSLEKLVSIVGGK